MDKTAIKNFAVRARNKLIEDITQKSYELGITNEEIKDIEIFEGGFRIKGLENSKIYKNYEINQREKLASNMRDKGFDQIIEEVAYTWFNRFIALRFMEVNEYLPTGVRVLSSIEEGKIEPDIIKEALKVDLDIDQEIVYKILDRNDQEDLYKYLFIKQCNELGKIMPMVFEEIADYTELLLPDNLLVEGSVIRDLVESIEEDDYKDQVEIIGWMYQYYISEKKDEVFADLKKNIKITKENIPAATQLFTPKWIVKYMVENSLGRLWLESHPGEELQSEWKYYLEEAEQDPEVQKKLDDLKDPNLNPEDIKILDPSMGSGHILVYAFDVLYDIYLKANYSERDIPQLILEKNIYGLDIDDRAGQLAAFALLMKARSKNRRIFRKKIELNICSIQESNGIPKEAIKFLVSPKDIGLVEYFNKEQVEYLIEVFHDAKEYGSILDVNKIDFDAIDKRIEEIRDGDTLDLFELQYRDVILEKMPPLVKQGRIMSGKYDVVCTNPPYMGTKGMNPKLSKLLKESYNDSKSDLYAVFIEKCIEYTKVYSAMITQHTWMFVMGFERLRKHVFNESNIHTMIHLGARAFQEIDGEVVQSCAFILRKDKNLTEFSTYIRLTNINNSLDKEKEYLSSLANYHKYSRFNRVRSKSFENISGIPVAYWLSDEMIKCFSEGRPLSEIADLKTGLSTTDNNRFLRFWYEVKNDSICFSSKTRDDALESNDKWFPYIKGGKNRKWYGNRELVVKWYNDGFEIREKAKGASGGRIVSTEYYFRESLTWSYISSDKFALRYNPVGSIFDSIGTSCFVHEKGDMNYILGLLNTKLVYEILQVLAPTMAFNPGAVGKTPVIKEMGYALEVNDLVKYNVSISKIDWDSFETSWNFDIHPLIKLRQSKALRGEPSTKDFRNNGLLDLSYKAWEHFTTAQFNQLKSNEEELNRIFIEIYGLQDELTPEVEDKDVTIRKADRVRDIKSFISYAVGCMLGRYSLDEEGLIYAGGEFDSSRYKTIIPTNDNVLVIADDEYFEDDIVNRFVEFVKVTFGEKTLEENLDYIGETLDKKTNETSKQAIRRYFLKGFYKDHVKTYSKRPIYWMFDSGRNDGFKALVYMHRYDSSTVARVRTDYLHRLQRQYESEVNHMDILLESEILAREKAAAKKRKDNLQKQIIECLAYDQVIAHVANQKIDIDLDDGVMVNYDKFQGIQIPQGDGRRPLIADLLSKI